MKKLLFITIISTFLLMSCLTPKDEEVVKDQPTEETIVAEEVTTPDPVDEVYEVTEEEYEETFLQIDDFVAILNNIISKGDFNSWKEYLSESYIEKYGSKEYLKELSENPVLKDYGVKLKTLRDYFRFVVVPSRSEVKIDEIQFVTEEKIRVYTYTQNTKFVVYQLIRNESGWLITE